MSRLETEERRSTELSFAGVWHNQHNSEMEIKIGADGLISGSFHTGTGGNSQNSEEFPITGFVSQDVIAFCVSFTGHGCVTSWVGQMNRETDSRSFQALWHMAVDVGNQSKKLLWRSILSGADEFQRGPRLSSESNMASQASHPLFIQSEDLSSAY